MPKQMFFNIDEKRRDGLLQSAFEEFTTYTLEEASIKRILDRVNIPRGSFYQYFEDLEDLYSFMIQGLQEKIYEDNFTKAPNDVDFFLHLEQSLLTRVEKIYNGVLEDDEHKFFANVRRSERGQMLFMRSSGMTSLVRQEEVSTVSERYNITPYEFTLVIETLLATIEKTMFKMLRSEITEKDAVLEIVAKFRIIRGMLNE